LREGEAQLDAIVRSAMDVIIIVDGDQRIVLFNAAAEKMFAYSASQAIGGPLDRFIPERFPQAHHAHVERFGRTGETSRRVGTQVRKRLVAMLGTVHGVTVVGEADSVRAAKRWRACD
jgi:PAS domain S-box-containing protein